MEYQAAKFIGYDSLLHEEEKQQSKVLKVSCNLNNAACKLKLKDCKEAKKLCTKVLLESFQLLHGLKFLSQMMQVLEIARRNVRRAQVSIQLADLELAEQALYVRVQHHCATPKDLYIAQTS